MTRTRSASEPEPIEAALWRAAELLRGRVDAGVARQLVLGLLALRALSPEGWGEATHKVEQGLPPAQALDQSIETLRERDPALAELLPSNLVPEDLSPEALRPLMGVLSDLPISGAPDTLGRVYEYLLSRFAAGEGRAGGEFYTPASVVNTLVALLQPRTGRLYDPCCGSGGMFVQALRHGPELQLVGQESNANTRRLAALNLRLRGAAGDLGAGAADTLRQDAHPDLRADFVLANPPFNLRGWGARSLARDPRWVFGLPPEGNANFAWLQHILARLAAGGRAAVVLANGSLSSTRGGEGELRQAMVRAGVVEAVIALPTQLFYATPIPACVWVLARDRPEPRDLLFIDASRLGRMHTRVHRVLEPQHIDRIASAYRGWREGASDWRDPGFCGAASLEQVAAQGFVLTPGRYVGAPERQRADEDQVQQLTAALLEQQARGAALDRQIAEALRTLGP